MAGLIENIVDIASLNNLAGNVMEWTTDQFPSPWPSGDQTDPWFPVTTANATMVVRGGRCTVTMVVGWKRDNHNT